MPAGLGVRVNAIVMYLADIMLYFLIVLFVVSLLCYIYLLAYFADGEDVSLYDFTSPEFIKFALLIIVGFADFGMLLNFVRYFVIR